MTHRFLSPGWSARLPPGGTDISPERGVLLGTGLFLALAVVEAVARWALGLDPAAGSVPPVLGSLALAASELVVLFAIVKRYWGPTPTQLLTRGSLAKRDLLVWVWVPLVFTWRGVYQSLYQGGDLSSHAFQATVLGLVLGEAVAAPLREEIVFRGLLFGGLRHWSRALGYTVTTALFTLGHARAFCVPLVDGPAHVVWGPVVLYVVFSVGMCRMYEKTGSLLLCVIMHALANLLQHIALVVGAALRLAPIG
ncbi:MAG: type II CAAX endopeptidase family protein [Gemmatimonadota bacterium]